MPLPPAAKVYLVGAGPGDPGLLTLRGRDLLARADVVVYDALTSPALLQYAPSAELIYVGKEARRHSLPQEEINRILIEQARCHAVVVRLKGGDPFLFGRGGEEALALVVAGVPFEVVPGVTAGIAVPAYAGIPPTQRGIASSVSFLTGHVQDEDAVLDLPAMLSGGTLVFYMGVANMPRIIQAILAMGRPESTPAAVIEWGTLARQRTITGTLADIHARCAADVIEAPALIVVGDVVALRERLNWFEARPLYGLRVAVTHSAQRQGDLERRLMDLGADVYPFPTMTIEAVESDVIAFTPGAFDWVVCTSVNSVDMLFRALDRCELDARALAGMRLCAVGRAAVEAIERHGLRVDVVAEGYRAHEVLASMAGHGPLQGKRVLLPRADIARSSLAASLREAGASVTEVVAYETRPQKQDRHAWDGLAAFAPDVVVFTNSSAATHFARLAEGATPVNAAFASIGPVTTRAANAVGMTIEIEAPRHDIPNLIEAICAWHAKTVQH